MIPYIKDNSFSHDKIIEFKGQILNDFTLAKKEIK
jgi:hypothetical protein